MLQIFFFSKYVIVYWTVSLVKSNTVTERPEHEDGQMTHTCLKAANTAVSEKLQWRWLHASTNIFAILAYTCKPWAQCTAKAEL